MARNWHWDINLTQTKIKGILAREADPRFPRVAGALVSRIDDPKEVFKWITPVVFCRRWRAIEQEIRSDEWTKEKAAFWKVTYLRLSKELRQKGEKIRQTARIQLDDFDKDLITKIRECRKKALMTQKELAEFMGYSQQFISNIEKGREKPNLDFLKKLAGITQEPLQLIFGTHETWLFKNKRASHLVQRGLKEAKEGRILKTKEDYSKHVRSED